MKLNDLAKRIHSDAKSMGWYDKGKTKTDVESLMMVVTELAEAVEELRNGHEPVYTYAESPKPEGWGVEIADAIIRLIDLAEYKGLDLESIIDQKLKYNLTRGYRHGGKLV